MLDAAQIAIPREGLDSADLASLGVFKPNREAPIHRWVSFTEGFSAQLVARELDRARRRLHVFDPFGGTGTTPLVAVQLGHRASWTEVNPYLTEVAQTKLAAASAPSALRERTIQAICDLVKSGPAAVPSQHPLLEINARRDFFQSDSLQELLGWVARFDGANDALARSLGRAAVGSAAVPASNMKRAVDLRRRTAAELQKPRPVVTTLVRDRLERMVSDLLESLPAQGSGEWTGSDARSLDQVVSNIDLVVTSPPYLNGTNYFRNTKLELLLLGLIQDERDLAGLRTAAVTAGINNVSRRIGEPVTPVPAQEVAAALDGVAYDQRIPKMVRAYFADMGAILSALRRAMSDGGHLVLDIGDSKFAGVHVDTPGILSAIATDNGWTLDDEETIRTRRSKDGSPLCQKLLKLSLN